MYLSPALIFREFSAAYPTETGGRLSLQPVLGRPVVPAAWDADSAGCFLPAAEPALGGMLLTLRQDGPPPLGQLAVDAPSPGALYNQAQQIFERYEAWQAALAASRLQGQSIQALLELSYPLFRRPLVVIGMDFAVIASVRGEAMEMVRGIFGATEETYAVVNALKQSRAYAEARQRDGCFYYQPDQEEGHGCLCVNIKKHGQTAYRLMMLDEDGSRDMTDGFLLQHLAEMVEHALLHNTAPAAAEDRSIGAILHTAVSDRTADYVTVSQRLEACGWRSSHEYLCVVLQLSYLDQKNLTVHAICSYIENILSGACAFQFKEDVVVFVDVTLSSMSLDDISSRLSCFVRDSLLKAGYSRVLLGHFNFRRQYDQACIALEVGSRRNPSFWIHRFNNIAFDYILEQATRKLPGYMISHERLLKLKYADEDNGTEYFRTLRLYLDNHLNAVQTARELFIHRSTFLYRLERIKAILATDLSSPDEILYLMLSFRLMDRESPVSAPAKEETAGVGHGVGAVVVP